MGVDSMHFNPPKKWVLDIFRSSAQVLHKLATKFLVKRCRTGTGEKVVKEVCRFPDGSLDKYNETSPQQIVEDVCNILMGILHLHQIQYTSLHSLYQTQPQQFHRWF
jgi:hypothetical protein